MKKGFALVLAAGSVVGLATPALAQDATFTGPRAEVLVGYDHLRPGSSEDFDNDDDFNRSIDDVAYGVGAGFDFGMGGLVLGVEGEWMMSNASTQFETTSFTTFGVSNFEVGRDLYAGARAGFAVTPSTLLYAKGGYTNTRLNILASDNATDTRTKAKLDGWRAGAGVEQMLNDNVYAKVEYRYSNYQRGEFEAPSGLESDRFDVDLDRHQVMVGFGARF
ncbi:outer membrane beta-barrel protein [Altererythrobacter sp. KTW20L]|uniref:outer membrane protein n=1 Tax=Altererythrobacter sp. KTW20L TaxID=2942210 RepID=UPI0020BE9E84|nr:outer membrane beta-barrel protein [Altererythrobacter sp. KTW20L]MCL6251766.1 outer membrane beta-barrel protein [Altererythrobacter sp. KTW20L]